jgi:hypothetical protein
MRKLFGNRQFKLLLLTLLVAFFFSIYSAIHYFARRYLFHDYVAIVFFLLPQTLLLEQGSLVADVFYNTLLGLLRASGISESRGIGDRTKNTVRFVTFLNTVPFIPIFAGPVLAPDAQVILVRYYMVLLGVLAVVHTFLTAASGHRAMNLLGALGTEPTIAPRKKIRGLLANFYGMAMSVLVLNIILASTNLVIYFPYYIAVNIATSTFTMLPPVAALAFDSSKVSKVRAPSIPARTVGGDRASHDQSLRHSKPDDHSRTPEALPLDA